MEIKIDNDGSNNSRFSYNTGEPGLIVLLVDQTSSTGRTASDKQNTIAELITKSVNSLIMNLILSNIGSHGTIKDRAFISIIGYGGIGVNSVEIIHSDSLSAFADNPLRTEKVKKKVVDGAGKLVEIEEEMAIWLENKSNGIPPENFNFLLNHLNIWHYHKGINYPKTSIIHFCEDEKEGFRSLLNSFKWDNKPYESPTIIEKLFV
jgi:hypothetical protein